MPLTDAKLRNLANKKGDQRIISHRWVKRKTQKNGTVLWQIPYPKNYYFQALYNSSLRNSRQMYELVDYKAHSRVHVRRKIESIAY